MAITRLMIDRMTIDHRHDGLHIPRYMFQSTDRFPPFSPQLCLRLPACLRLYKCLVTSTWECFFSCLFFTLSSLCVCSSCLRVCFLPAAVGKLVVFFVSRPPPPPLQWYVACLLLVRGGRSCTLITDLCSVLPPKWLIRLRSWLIVSFVCPYSLAVSSGKFICIHLFTRISSKCLISWVIDGLIGE